MKGLLIRWIISAVALVITAQLAKWLNIGIDLNLNIWWSPLLVVIALSIINALIRPLVILMTLPLNCLTLGLFTVVVNALMFWIVGSGWLPRDVQGWVPGFRVVGFLAALFGSVVIGIISGMANHLVNSRE